MSESEKNKLLKEREREKLKEREEMKKGCVVVEGVFWREHDNLWLEGRFFMSTQPDKPRVNCVFCVRMFVRCIHCVCVCVCVCVMCVCVMCDSREVMYNVCAVVFSRRDLCALTLC